MSSPHSTGDPPSYYATGASNQLSARMGQLSLVPSGGVPMPEPRLWAPTWANDANYSKPLPPFPPAGPQLPPRPRPPHIQDRPNPYDLMPPLPRPPMMPIPSIYMQNRPAISESYSDPPAPSRPAFSPAPSVRPSTLPEQRPSKPPVNTRPRLSTPSASSSLLPPSSKQARASSVPPSPTISYEDGVQCSADTNAGKRCTRMVKSPHPYLVATPAKDGDIERFCFQHVKNLLVQSGFFARYNSKHWVEFNEWIPHYLSDETKTALRIEMEKPLSAADVPGYIYAYEIRDSKKPNFVNIKVGRAVNMVKRLDEWSKQCGSKEVVLRGWWPGKVVDNDGAGPSLLKGRIQAGEKGKCCHRLERLIHLELSDLMVNQAYLSDDFLKPPKPSISSGPSSGAPKSQVSNAKRILRAPCRDCGKTHKEIFSFTRINAGKLKGREWERVVQPVIERWGRFVEEAM